MCVCTTTWTKIQERYRGAGLFGHENICIGSHPRFAQQTDVNGVQDLWYAQPGSRLHFQGANFTDAAKIFEKGLVACRFNGLYFSNATVVSDTEATCPTASPDTSKGQVKVRVEIGVMLDGLRQLVIAKGTQNINFFGKWLYNLLQ